MGKFADLAKSSDPPEEESQASQLFNGLDAYSDEPSEPSAYRNNPSSPRKNRPFAAPVVELDPYGSYPLAPVESNESEDRGQYPGIGATQTQYESEEEQEEVNNVLVKESSPPVEEEDAETKATAAPTSSPMSSLLSSPRGHSPLPDDEVPNKATVAAGFASPEKPRAIKAVSFQSPGTMTTPPRPPITHANTIGSFPSQDSFAFNASHDPALEFAIANSSQLERPLEQLGRGQDTNLLSMNPPAPVLPDSSPPWQPSNMTATQEDIEPIVATQEDMNVDQDEDTNMDEDVPCGQPQDSLPGSSSPLTHQPEKEEEEEGSLRLPTTQPDSYVDDPTKDLPFPATQPDTEPDKPLPATQPDTQPDEPLPATQPGEPLPGSTSNTSASNIPGFGNYDPPAPAPVPIRAPPPPPAQNPGRSASGDVETLTSTHFLDRRDLPDAYSEKYGHAMRVGKEKREAKAEIRRLRLERQDREAEERRKKAEAEELDNASRVEETLPTAEDESLIGSEEFLYGKPNATAVAVPSRLSPIPPERFFDDAAPPIKRKRDSRDGAEKRRSPFTDDFVPDSEPPRSLVEAQVTNQKASASGGTKKKAASPEREPTASGDSEEEGTAMILDNEELYDEPEGEQDEEEEELRVEESEESDDDAPLALKIAQKPKVITYRSRTKDTPATTLDKSEPKPAPAPQISAVAKRKQKAVAKAPAKPKQPAARAAPPVKPVAQSGPKPKKEPASKAKKESAAKSSNGPSTKVKKEPAAKKAPAVTKVAASTAAAPASKPGPSWQSGVVPSSVPDDVMAEEEEDDTLPTVSTRRPNKTSAKPRARGGASKAGRSVSTSVAPTTGRETRASRAGTSGVNYNEDTTEEELSEAELMSVDEGEAGPSTNKRKRGEPVVKREGVKSKTGTHATTPRAAKRQKTMPSSMRSVADGGVRVFGLYTAGSGYFAGIVHEGQEGQYLVEFDNGHNAVLPLENVVRSALQVNDRVVITALRRAAVVRDVSNEDFIMVTELSRPNGKPIKIFTAEFHIAVCEIDENWTTRRISEADIKFKRSKVAHTPSRAGHAGPPVSKTTTSDRLVGTGFLLTSSTQGDNEGYRLQIKTAIGNNRGKTFDNWEDLVSYNTAGKKDLHGKRWSAEQEDFKWIGPKNLDRLFLLADAYNFKPKYLIALALGVPCLNTSWLEPVIEGLDDCPEEDWSKHLLPQGYSRFHGTVVSQFVDYQWGTSPLHLSKITQNFVASKLFADESVLLIGAEFVPDKNSVTSGAISYVALAMGAVSVEAIANETIPTKKKSHEDYNWVVLTDAQFAIVVKANIGEVNYVSSTWVKDCLLAGRVLKAGYKQ